MKNFTLLIVAILGLTGITNAQAPNWMWAKSVGGTTNDNGTSIATDPSGNIFVGGTYEGTIDFDPGPGVSNLTSLGILDGYLLKLDPAGNFLWALSIGDTHTDVVYDIAADPQGNVIVTGRFGNTVDFDPGVNVSSLTSNGYLDMYVAKYSASGSLVWAKSMGGQNDDQCLAIALDGSGNIYGTGYFQGSCDFDPGAATYALVSPNGNYDAFVFKLENGGGFIWAKSFGGVLNDAGGAIALDGANNVYTTGYYNGMIDMDPGAGSSIIPPAGGQDCYISKLDDDGNFIWAKPLGGSQQDIGRSIFADATGNVYTSGDYRGNGDFDPGPGVSTLSANGDYDFFISKLDSAGTFGWAKSIGSYGPFMVDNNYSMAADNDGNIYVSGFFRNVVDFDPGPGNFPLTAWGGTENDGYISKYDTGGNFVWAKAITGSQSEIATAIAVDNTNRLVVAGHFMSPSVDFGVDTVYNAWGGTGDAFIAKLDSVFLSSTIDVQQSNNITIRPNPAQSFILVGNIPTTDELVTINIIDITGKKVYEKSISNLNELSIDTRSISNGVYVVKVESQSFLKTTRLVINN